MPVANGCVNRVSLVGVAVVCHKGFAFDCTGHALLGSFPFPGNWPRCAPPSAHRDFQLPTSGVITDARKRFGFGDRGSWLSQAA